MNSPFPVPISCHIYVLHKKQNMDNIRSISPPGEFLSHRHTISAHNVPTGYLKLSLFLLFPINIPRLQILVTSESKALGSCPQRAFSPPLALFLLREADTSLPAYVNCKHAASYLSFVSPGKQHFMKQLQTREGENASDVLHRGYLEIRGATIAERKSPKKIC